MFYVPHLESDMQTAALKSKEAITESERIDIPQWARVRLYARVQVRESKESADGLKANDENRKDFHRVRKREIQGSTLWSVGVVRNWFPLTSQAD